MAAPIPHLHKSREEITSVLVAIGIALVPKCPLCCAAYLGLLSSIGIASLPFYGWILPTLWMFLLLNLLFLGVRMTRNPRASRPFMVSACGVISILAGKLWLSSDALCWAGVAAILTASAWNLANQKCVKKESEKGDRHLFSEGP